MRELTWKEYDASGLNLDCFPWRFLIAPSQIKLFRSLSRDFSNKYDLKLIMHGRKP